jgi:histidine phosphotransfer protein HptB
MGMMQAPVEGTELVNWTAYQQARAELGGNFVRILGYFREDGMKAVDQIETAMRARDAAAMILPAHTLKGESRQFGADPLGDRAEIIENIARTSVETRESPDAALEHVVGMRTLFSETLQLLEREANPLVMRKPQGGFGRRALG